MERLIYTIENGYIDEENEKYCTNETCYLAYEDYVKNLKKIINGYVNNNTKKGFYIECYCDIEEITKEDLKTIEENHYMNDCSSKISMIQQFIIDNSGEVIDYLYD